MSQNQWLMTPEWAERVNTNSPPCDWCCLDFCKLPVSCCSSRGGRKSRGERKKGGEEDGGRMQPTCLVAKHGLEGRERHLATSYSSTPPPTPHPSPGPIIHSEKCFRHPQPTGALPEDTDSNQSQSQGQTWSCMLGNTKEMMHNDLYVLNLWKLDISDSY